MVKVKNKKRNLSEKVNTKNDSKSKKTLNPFEVHINKEKLRVLGRKLKNDRGLPGVSRAKAQKKRKRTLLPEYEVQNKSNKFVDKRIGERNGALSAEDKSMARYTAVRVKQHNKKSIFNLADDEVLTHKGQTLSEIEKFDDPRSDDDEDDEGQKKSGNLERGFVEDAHFGGGMLRKADGTKSHKDLIDQLITESKKRKAEKQKQKEATLELTEKLDTEWKDLLPIVSKSKKLKDEEEPKSKPQVDDYDKVMRELKFEARGTPSDKLKSEDEIAKEEKEKLERLEKERLDRMRGVVAESKVRNHRSADDLDDNFEFDWNTPDVTLSYNDDGVSNIQDGEPLKNITENEDGESGVDEGEEEESDTTEDDLSDLKESDDSDSEEETRHKNNKDKHTKNKFEDVEDIIKVNHKSEGEDAVIENNQNQSESDDEDVAEANLPTDVEDAVVKANHKSEEIIHTTDASEDDENSSFELNSISKRKIEDDDNAESKKPKMNGAPDLEKIKEDLLQRKAMMEAAREELPYTYSLPETYEDLQEALQNQPPQHHSVIIERMIKCNHQSLKEGNKDALGFLFVYLLQYLSDISDDAADAESAKNCFQIFSFLVPQLFDLAQINPESTHSSVLEVIKEKQSDYRDARTKFPKIDVLLYLKLISALFSTSDYKHAVVVPSIVFIEEMLTTCKVRTRRDVAFGLFLVSLIAEYTVLSKRYLPASVKFLSGILHMTIPKTGVQLLKVLPPFKRTCSFLVLSDGGAIKVDNLKLEVGDLAEDKDFDEPFKVKAMHVTLGLLQAFYSNFQVLASCPEILETPLGYLKKVPERHYPDTIKGQIHRLVESIEEFVGNRKLDFIVTEKKRPKALRMYEPNIVRVFDGRRHKVQSKEKMERDKLLHKIKREKKGAIREIRRDRAFLGRVKIGKKIQSDVERKEKVKRIYSEAATQQSELNTMDRENAKSKKK